MKCSSKNKGYTLIELLTVVFIIAAIISLALPHLRRAILKAQLTSCQSNLRNLVSALEQFRNDSDKYPDTLSELVPRYFDHIPVCPAAGFDSYTTGYTISSQKDEFTVACKGNNHAALGYEEDQPYYNHKAGGLRR
jgi:general secretion pathway protein G